VRIRGEGPTKGDGNLMPATFPDIGRSFQAAREAADLTIPEAAAQAGLGTAAVEALESGSVGPQHDRIDTLRTLRTYANSLGLPGDEYVLIAVESWPSTGPVILASGDTAVVPVVSISSAPAGGHSPAGSSWPGDATGVTDTTTTGMIAHVGPLSAYDTGRVPMVDTGEVRAIGYVPRALKVSVGIVATLVVLSGAALIAHNHLQGWYDEGHTNTTRWYHQAKSALGFTTPTKAHHTGTPTPPVKLATKVTYQADPNGHIETMNVTSTSFTVRIVAVTYGCWVQAIVAGQPNPVYAQVLPANQTETFTVTSSMTINTGSAAGRAFLFKGSKLIGFYYPPKAPFVMTFNAVN
jgi:Helix-turn-helix domain